MRLALVALFVGGCTFPVRSEAFTCQIDNDCDADRSCESGLCVVGARSGDGPGNGLEPDAGVVVDAPPDADPFIQIAMQCTAAGYTKDLTTGGLYRIVTTNTQWPAAQAACKADVLGATHLIVLSTQAEVTFMAGKIGSNGHWVGLLDNNTNVFVSVTGETNDVRPFDSGQPDNGGGDENCVQMKPGGKLDDDQCDSAHRYICECDGRMSTP
jgi:Lectin C-type domain